MANTKKGVVVSAKTDKTIKVLVTTYKNHPIYRKRFIQTKKYLVHDPNNSAKDRDQVIIRQCRPISRRKRWILDQIVDLNTTKKTPKTVKAKTKED